MGYRSDVGLGIIFPDENKLNEFCQKVMAFQPETVRLALEEYCRPFSHIAEGLIIASFEDVKWYPSYDIVQGHETLQILAREHGAATAFVRVGEELTDTEREILEPINSSEMEIGELSALMDVLYENFYLTVRADYPMSGKPLAFDDQPQEQQP